MSKGRRRGETWAGSPGGPAVVLWMRRSFAMSTRGAAVWAIFGLAVTLSWAGQPQPHAPVRPASAPESTHAPDAAPGPIYEMPFELVGGKICLPVLVNGKGPYPFWIDTCS